MNQHFRKVADEAKSRALSLRTAAGVPASNAVEHDILASLSHLALGLQELQSEVVALRKELHEMRETPLQNVIKALKQAGIEKIPE